jgi:hypothetical protein
MKIIINIFFGSIIFTSFTLLKNNILNCFPLLWNNHITKRSWVYLNQDEGKIYIKNSDISEGDALKMAKNSWDAIYLDTKTNQKFSTKERRNASFKFVTAGYKAEDQNRDLGYDFKILNNNKKPEAPYIFRITNNASEENPETLGKLREVGFVFENWPQYWRQTNEWTGGAHSFSDNYQVEKLNKILVKFKFRLVNYSAPLSQYKNQTKEKWLGSYASCDLRFCEYDENGNVVKNYLLGVLFSNPLKVDYNDNPNDGILWGENNTKEKIIKLLIHGEKNGIKEINKSSDIFQAVEIDFKSLIGKYFKINKNHKNIIVGLDIYSNTRSTNLTYDIQDIQVIGCQKKF